ncbi:hypothetical protein V1525DRAFT_393571 [Lipomyces kononenkoae]|uniref:Uncharacterized protein n=1 Tax=Lipomyces kononenkoae TaxID=34357 RepID=A0ACC3TDS8_LIPKO
MHKNDSYQRTPPSSIPRRSVRPPPPKHNASPRSIKLSNNGSKAFKASNDNRSPAKKDDDPRASKKSVAKKTISASGAGRQAAQGSLKRRQQGHVGPNQVPATSTTRSGTTATTTTTTTTAAASAAATTTTTAAAAAAVATNGPPGRAFAGAEVLELDNLSGRQTIGRSATKRHCPTLSEKFLESLNREDSISPTQHNSMSPKVGPRQKIFESVSKKAKGFNSMKNPQPLVKAKDDDAAKLDGSLLELQVLRRRAVQEFVTSRSKREAKKTQVDRRTTTAEFPNNFEYLKSELVKDTNRPKTNLFDMDDIDEEYVCRTATIYQDPVKSKTDRVTRPVAMSSKDSAIERRLMTPQDDGSSDLSDLVLSPALSPLLSPTDGEVEQSHGSAHQLPTSLQVKVDDGELTLIA